MRSSFIWSWLVSLILTAKVFAILPYGWETRPPGGPFLDGKVPTMGPTISGSWKTVPAFTNLTFTNALGLTFVPGTTRLVVWEREGRVWQFENNPSASIKTKVLDISAQCQGWDDSGLLGLAFHPGFATNRFVFVYYTWVTPGTVVGSPTMRPPTFKNNAYHDRLSRFTLDSNNVAVPGSELVLVDQVASSVWHNGGGLFFHPRNGFLYWTDGDDETAPTQTINQNLLSGVFRIDVDQRGGGISHPIPRQPNNGTTANYFIPNDNPFAGQAGVLEEFYALGLRSPHRMTIDPVSERIFIGDVGAGSWEEIDVIEPADPGGLNFQWSTIEGLHGDLTPPYIGVNRRPVLNYGHDEGQAVIGGYIYRGNEFAADLGGKYIFGDNVQGKIWAMDETGVPATKKLLAVLPKGPGSNSGADYTGLSSFGVDANNELYLCQMGNLGGRIYKLSRSGPPPVTQTFPALLSQTGAFDDVGTLSPSPSLIPYAVNSPLWSDAAVKSRWMAVPTNGSIAFKPTGEWTFPSGTVFVKHFELVVDETQASVPRRRLETRLLVRDTNGTVFGATYKWRPDNSDADLLADKLDEDVTIQTASGPRHQTWHYPSRNECLLCHSTASGGVLGVKTRQSNREMLYPSAVTDNQLRAWNHVGLFAPAISEADIPGFSHLAAVTDSQADLQLRVRSYLDANCAHCHRPGGVPALWDARFDTALENAGIVNGTVAQSLGIPGAKVVVPGHPEKSVMLVRDSSLDPVVKMPPLARNLIDSQAMETIREWITGLPAPLDSIPAPWLHEDIGSVGSPGDATYAGKVLTINASGDDIWNSADAFYYVYQPLVGDGELIARVTRIDNTDGWAKAGIMVREDLSAGSRQANVSITPGNGSAFQRRTVPNQGSDHTGGPGVTAPYWVRLNRTGNVITGYVSPNGTTWTKIDAVTLALPLTVYVGFSVTAHNNGAVTTAQFDSIRASGAVLPLNTPPTVTLTSPAGGSNLISPGVTLLSANASDSDGAVAKVEYFDGPNKIGEAAAQPYGVNWTSPALGLHTLSARVVDNLGAASISQAITITVSGLAIPASSLGVIDGSFHFSFVGQPGTRYLIEQSIDLQTWTPFSTNTATAGQVDLSDATGVGDWRFYRVRLAP
ncbi:MAG TPA: PQQ-dependent sugar dehydrogenase [Candidatus Limnocylindria bacterium]|nr:PQQ-dependent sugar dehydrogenase [Candidatus Limnocylindria bacterium]